VKFVRASVFFWFLLRVVTGRFERVGSNGGTGYGYEELGGSAA